VINIAEPVLAEAVRLGDQYLQAELAYWLRKAGRAVDVSDVDHPFALLAGGDWQAAARVWAERGCPYQQAVALADSSEPEALLEALSILDSLGAAPLARQVRAGLRQLGVLNVPRGPMAGTRENPAGLTERQLEVLQVLADGLTNGEIASQLVLSVRTVDRHVAEILAKLGVASRRYAEPEPRRKPWASRHDVRNWFRLPTVAGFSQVHVAGYPHRPTALKLRHG